MKRIRLSFSVLIAILVMLAVISCGGGGGGGGGGAAGNGSTGNNNGTENNSSTSGNGGTTAGGNNENSGSSNGSSTSQTTPINAELANYIYFAESNCYCGNDGLLFSYNVSSIQIHAFDGKGSSDTEGRYYSISKLSKNIDGYSPAEILSDCINHIKYSSTQYFGKLEYGTSSFTNTKETCWESLPYKFIAGTGAQEGEGFYIICPASNLDNSGSKTYITIRENGMLYFYECYDTPVSAVYYPTYRQRILANSYVIAKDPAYEWYTHMTPQERMRFEDFYGNRFNQIEFSADQKIKVSLNTGYNRCLVGGTDIRGSDFMFYLPAVCNTFEELKASILYRETNPFGDYFGDSTARRDSLLISATQSVLVDLAELLKTYSRDVELDCGNAVIPPNIFKECTCIKRVYVNDISTIGTNIFPEGTLILDSGNRPNTMGL